MAPSPELMKLYGRARKRQGYSSSRYCGIRDLFDHISPWQQKIYSMLFYNKKMVPAARISRDIKKAYGKSYSSRTRRPVSNRAAPKARTGDLAGGASWEKISCRRWVSEPGVVP